MFKYVKTKLLWLSSISCNGNAHSFLNYDELEVFLDNFEFIYHPIIDSLYLPATISLSKHKERL